MDLDSAMTGLLRGNAFFSSGSYAAARNAYSRAVDGLEGPGGGGAALDGDAGKLLALLYSNRSAARLMAAGADSGEAALGDAREAVRLEPRRCKFHGRVGAALHALGQHADAVAAYERGLALPGGATHKGLLEGVAAVQRDLSGKSIPRPTKAASGASSSASSPPSNSPAKPDLAAPSNSSDGPPKKRKRSELDESSGDQISESTESEEAVVNSSCDADVSAFVAEISDIGTTVRKKARAVDDACLGSPAQEVQRILCKNHYWVNLNPFEVLQLPPLEANSEDIKQRYRALCALVHPDKCSIEGAQRAFEYINAAYRALTDESRRKVVLGLIEAAYTKADAELKRERHASSSSTSSPSSIDEKRRKFALITFAETEEARRRAEKNQQAYRKREDEQKAEGKRQLEDAYAAEKAWQNGVNDRVSDWQDFAGIKKAQGKKSKKGR